VDETNVDSKLNYHRLACIIRVESGRRVEAGWEEETCFVWKAHTGSWIYQEDFIGGV